MGIYMLLYLVLGFVYCMPLCHVLRYGFFHAPVPSAFSDLPLVVLGGLREFGGVLLPAEQYSIGSS